MKKRTTKTKMTSAEGEETKERRKGWGSIRLKPRLKCPICKSESFDGIECDECSFDVMGMTEIDR